jgi:HEAT repeat protein
MADKRFTLLAACCLYLAMQRPVRGAAEDVQTCLHELSSAIDRSDLAAVLLQATTDDGANTRIHKAYANIVMSDLPVVEKAIFGDVASERTAAIYLLRSFEQPEAVKLLSKIFKSVQKKERLLLLSLMNEGDSTQHELISEIFLEKEDDCKRAAAIALTKLGDPAPLGYFLRRIEKDTEVDLTDALNRIVCLVPYARGQSSKDVRDRWLEWWRKNSGDYPPFLDSPLAFAERLLRDPDEATRTMAATALQDWALPVILKRVEEEDLPEIRQLLVDRVGDLPAAIPVFRKLLASRHDRDKEQGARGLSRALFSPPEGGNAVGYWTAWLDKNGKKCDCIEKLSHAEISRKLLTDPDPEVRQAALRGRTPKWLDNQTVLNLARSDSVPSVQLEAIKSLGTLNGWGVKFLIEMMKSEQNPKRRSAIGAALDYDFENTTIDNGDFSGRPDVAVRRENLNEYLSFKKWWLENREMYSK